MAGRHRVDLEFDDATYEQIRLIAMAERKSISDLVRELALEAAELRRQRQGDGGSGG